MLNRLDRRGAAKVLKVVLEIHLRGKIEGNGAKNKADNGGDLEELENFGFCPGFGEETVVRSLGNASQALDENREHQDGCEHTEENPCRCYNAKFVESLEMSCEQSEECCDSGEACQDKRLEHTLLGFFKDFFQRGLLAQQFLGGS